MRRGCGGNDALIFASGHLTLKKRKGQLVAGASLKTGPMGSFGPRATQRICRPGNVLNYMTFKVLSISKCLLFRDSLLTKFPGSVFIFTR